MYELRWPDGSVIWNSAGRFGWGDFVLILGIVVCKLFICILELSTVVDGLWVGVFCDWVSARELLLI